MTAPPPGCCDAHVHVFGPFDRFPLTPGRAYTPGPASLEQLRALHRDLGIDRVVLVQPSVYGADNSCLVDALGRLGAPAAGVAVVAEETSDEQLSDLDAAGVRGARLNVGTSGATGPASAAGRLRALAARLSGVGWHLQLFAHAALVRELAEDLATLPVPVVIDHFGLVAGPGPELDALCELLRGGRTWVKMSSPERVSGDPDGSVLASVAHRLLETRPDRLVWASDWPHTDMRRRGDPSQIEPFRPVDDARSLQRLRGWTADEALWRAVLVDNPATLYGFRAGEG